MKKKSHDFYPLKKLFDGIFNPTTFGAPLMGLKNPTARRTATWDKKSHEWPSRSRGTKTHTTAYHPSSCLFVDLTSTDS